jgi:DNA polymerase V
MSTIDGHPIPFEARTRLRIPLVAAKVEAGFPSPADDHLERSLDLNEHLVKNPAATFFVRVKGDSMRDAGISNSDILVVDRSLSPEDGQVVVAMLDGDFTVKRLRKRKGRFFLVAENNTYPPIEVGEEQELVVWGVVTFVIHQPR